MKKLMTAEQAFNVSMNTYPTLYASKNLEAAKFKYFDHALNVIGSGVNDQEGFIEHNTINKKNKTFLDFFPAKYIGPDELFECFTKMKQVKNYTMFDENSALPELLTKEEMAQRTDIVEFLPVNNISISKYLRTEEEYYRAPYPNFQKQYSLVWNCDLNILDKSWIEEAINFYTITKDFFASDNVHHYHNAVPKNENKLKFLIEQYEQSFAREKKEGMSEIEYFDKISKAYEIPFNGNTLELIQNRWDKELIRINGFIDETLESLNLHLASRNDNTVEAQKNKNKLTKVIITNTNFNRNQAIGYEPVIGTTGHIVEDTNTPENHTCIRFLDTKLGYAYDAKIDDIKNKFVKLYVPNENFEVVLPKKNLEEILVRKNKM